MPDVGKSFNFLNKLAAFITTVSIIGGAYYYYRTTIWYPKLTVLNIDWEKGIATIRKKSKTYILYKNQTLAVGGDFGIKFSGDTDDNIDRIELYKNFLTYEVIAKK